MKCHLIFKKNDQGMLSKLNIQYWITWSVSELLELCYLWCPLSRSLTQTRTFPFQLGRTCSSWIIWRERESVCVCVSNELHSDLWLQWFYSHLTSSLTTPQSGSSVLKKNLKLPWRSNTALKSRRVTSWDLHKKVVQIITSQNESDQCRGILHITNHTYTVYNSQGLLNM